MGLAWLRIWKLLGQVQYHSGGGDVVVFHVTVSRFKETFSVTFTFRSSSWPFKFADLFGTEPSTERQSVYVCS